MMIVILEMVAVFLIALGVFLHCGSTWANLCRTFNACIHLGMGTVKESG
jgi:hypothetical protein